MPITFTEEDFQVSPAQPKAGFFSEQDFAPKLRKTPQQVMQKVAAAQASRDVVSPPETQGLIGQIAAGLETPVRVLNSPTLDIGSAFSLAKQAEIMGGRNYSIPTAKSYPAWRATQLGELSRSSGGADYGPGNTAFPQIDQRLQEYFKNNILRRKISQPGLTLQDIVSVLNRENVAPVLQPVQEPSLPSQVVGGVVGAGEDLVGGLLNFLTSPAGAVTAGAGSVGPVVQNALKAAFGASLLGSAVQGGQETIARSEQGDVGGTVRSGLGTVIGGGLGTHLLKKGVKDAWNSRVLTAEIVPPLQRPVAPVGRQLQAPEQSFIDAEVVVPPRLPAPGERPTMPVGSPLDRPAGAARFGVDPTGKVVDISQLSLKEQIELYRGPKEFVPREQYVRPSQGPIPIIGEQKMMPNPLPNVDQPVVPFQNETRPLKPAYVPSKMPVEPSGGEVSFRAPASAEAIPSAGQSAPKGMRIKAAMERGQKRRGETGALFPTGAEGRPLQPYDKAKKHDVTFMGKSGMANWPHGMWLSPDGKILDASPGHYESGADYLGEQKFDWRKENANFEDSLDYIFETMRIKGFVQLRGTSDGIEIMSGPISRTQKAALERWGIENEKKVIDNTESAMQPKVIYEPPVQGGMQILKGMEKGKQRRGETGSVFPQGDEGRVPEQRKEKPQVAKLSTSGNKNPLGDPMGSTYYATPEDWNAWQKVQTDFKDLLSKGAEFDGPEMMKVRQENENIKNRYGGMPPVEPKSGGIGGGIKGAVDKNKEAGSVENPFARIVNKFKNKEKKKRGNTFALSGPRIALDPKESGFKDVTKKVDAQQLWNRVKNKLTPAERDIYEKNGVDKMIVGMGKVSPEEAAEMLQESGPEVQVHSYGMEGKVSEEKREYDRMTHEWYDTLDARRKNAVDFIAGRAANKVTDPFDGLPHPVKTEVANVDQAKLKRYVELAGITSNESRDTSPRATSAYETVSPFSVNEPMPEWTKSREGKNVQRVDVVIPRKGKAPRKPDDLHTNLDDTEGWAMIQYKTGPKGEKIAVLAEVQAADKNDLTVKDYNRLILKAAIDQARKEGATHIMVSDAETAMMTEGHDLQIEPTGSYLNDKVAAEQHATRIGGRVTVVDRGGGNKRYNVYGNNPTQEPGMRLNYDTILPKIMEELSGGKGERVSLGEHKNSREDGYNGPGTAYTDLSQRKIRQDLIFRNPDGTPKTDVSGTMYKIPQTDKKFSVFEKDRPESVAGRLYVNPIGPIIKQTVKDVATLGKKVKEVGTDFIRAYSEPLQEQMGRLGGPVGKMVSEEAGQIISRGKELYGELTPVIDPAKKQVGKMMRGGTTWMRGLNEVTPYASFNNFFGANEGAVQIPTNAKRGMKVSADANLVIGKMAERANPGFKASGSLQRIMTPVGYDFIVNGGEGRNYWIEGQAKLNNVSLQDTQRFFDKMKETLGDPSSDAASLDRINQDFTRKFPRTITHIKTATGWHEVVVSDPFNYLEQAAQRTAHSVAFREVYPLIEHNGQWVQSGKLQATRKAIMKELDKGSDIVKFDNLVKALQGHPLDTFKGGATTAIGAVSGTIGSPLKALMLSGNAPVNIGEVLSGGPSIFIGYTTMGKAVAKMLTDNTFYDQLELTGARNKAMYNMALDPSSPLRSVAREVATGVRVLTGQQFLNEIQEATAAASAKVYSDAIKGGQMSKYSLNRAKALFRAMGFNEGQASKMVKGDVELLKQFENRAAAWLTTGNQSTAEMSRLGASRLFNAAFWFHKYPQMTLNQFRSVGGNWINDVLAYAKKPTKENWSPLYHNTVLMGRLLGGRSLQGAITLGILAGMSGGIYGIYQIMREAKEESLKFAVDSLVSGFNGPLSVMQRLNQNVKGGESFTKELVKLSAPASINQDLIDMGMGVGRYAGMSKMESISTFLESKTPISRTIRMGLAVGGLVEKDLELEVAMKAFYKWRKEQPGFVPMGQMGGTDEQVEIRSGMQKVKKAIESGEDWVAELKKVKDTKGAGASLRAGTMLQLNGKPLDAEQMKSLEKRLGANGLEKIKLRDAMVREVGRELNEKTESGEKQAPEEIKKPTGKWAIDYETDSVRSERVMGRLDPKVQEFLKKNGVEDVGYTPSLKRGPKRQQLTVEQAKVLEDELVVQLDKMVGTLAKNKNLESQTPKLRQTLISNMLEGARKIAMAKSLGKIPQDPEQQRK